MKASILFIAAALCLLSTGCDADQTAGVSIDFTKLNWQVGALILLAYLANSNKHFSVLAGVVKKLLQGLKILPQDQSQEDLSAQEVARLLAELQLKLRNLPVIQADLLALQAKCLQADRMEANAPKE